MSNELEVMNSNPQLDDARTQPVVLVTGSGRPRVGNVIARYLGSRGYRVALHYHSSENEAESTREQMTSDGVECRAYQANVRAESEVDEMVQRVKDDFGRLDVLVTTSSVWSPKPLDDITAEDLCRNFEVNTLGTFYAARAAGRVMVEQPTGGAIITIGDWSIDRPYVDHAAYFISKGSIPTLTRVLAVELASRNSKIRVNCIHPGPVMLPPGLSDEEQAERAESTLLKTADNPTTVAQAVEFFINNPFVTGACLPVDGGRHMYAAT